MGGLWTLIVDPMCDVTDSLPKENIINYDKYTVVLQLLGV